MLRQLDALGVAERLRASSVSAAGNVALSSVTPSLHPPMQPSTLGSFIVQSNPNIGPLFQQDEQRGKPVLLHMLNEIYVRRGTPLPPALTGINNPTWDPTTTPFKFELGSERGIIKVAGHDVDLFKFWQALFAAGFTQKVCQFSSKALMHMLMSFSSYLRWHATEHGPRSPHNSAFLQTSRTVHLSVLISNPLRPFSTHLNVFLLA